MIVKRLELRQWPRLSVMFIFMLASLAAAPATKLPVGQRTPLFSVAWKEDGALEISLTNRGERDIIVDKDLVIPIRLELLNDKAEEIQSTQVKDADAPKLAPMVAGERFVKLAKGETLRRTIDLKEPIRQWRSWHVTFSQDGARVHQSYGTEDFIKVDAGDVRGVRVSYRIEFDDPGGILWYTGKSVRDLGLYNEPLSATARRPEKVDGKKP